MGGHFLELASYATAVVDDLVIVGANDWTFGTTGDYDSAVLRTGDDRMLLARRPATAAAAQEQDAMSHRLAALTQGLRGRLPFKIPVEVGYRKFRDSQIAIYEFIPGTTADRVPLEHDSLVVAEIGRAIAGIHALPRQSIEAAGLPTQSPADARQSVELLLARARDSGYLPAALDERWGSAIDDATLWDFVPSIIHGSLDRGSFLTNGAGVVGVLDWSDLRIGDPAHDMSWLQTLDGAVLRAVYDEYTDARGASVDRQLRQRALLYAELELVRWLLHGVDTGNAAIIADAEQLLDGLVNRVRSLAESELRHETLPVLDLESVQELLADAGTKARHPGPRLEKPEHGGTDGDEFERLDDDLLEHETGATAADVSPGDDGVQEAPEASVREVPAADAPDLDAPTR